MVIFAGRRLSARPELTIRSRRRAFIQMWLTGASRIYFRSWVWLAFGVFVARRRSAALSGRAATGGC